MEFVVLKITVLGNTVHTVGIQRTVPLQQSIAVPEGNVISVSKPFRTSRLQCFTGMLFLQEALRGPFFFFHRRQDIERSVGAPLFYSCQCLNKEASWKSFSFWIRAW